MDIESSPHIDDHPAPADRAKFLSQALADAARRARVSKRSRKAFSGGGFQARRGARAFRIVMIVSFFLMVAIPSISAGIYYAFIASDQYVAEAKFTVSGGEPPSADALGSFTGIPAIAIIQDTQIVVNFIKSRAAIEKLKPLIDIRELYARPSADFIARSNPKKPIEKFVRYWDRMCDISIGMPAGIVDLKVRAFSPEDSTNIVKAVLEISEALINEMNDRMNHDAVAGAEIELDRTSARLTKARIALEAARNDTGILDATKIADSINKLITESKLALLQLQQEYATQLKYVNANAPQMKAMKSRMEATTGQISELESKLTQTKLTSIKDPTLASSMTRFAELDLERQVAERLYAGAAASLEIARMTAEHKMMYLNTFVKPAIPQEAQYPRRWLASFGVLGGSLAIWGLFCGLIIAVRNYKA